MCCTNFPSEEGMPDLKIDIQKYWLSSGLENISTKHKEKKNNINASHCYYNNMG